MTMSSTRQWLRLLLLLLTVVRATCLLTCCDGRPRRFRTAICQAFPQNDQEDTLASMSRSSFLLSILTMPLVVHAESDAPVDIGPSTKPPPLHGISFVNRETLQESLSGAIAGSAITIVKSTVKYPLDTATVRLQLPNSKYSLQRPLELLEDSYRGVFIPLLANIPAGATFFGAKDACKSLLLQQQPHIPTWFATCLAVGVAQFPYWGIRNPSELVKTRQQSGVPGFGDDVSVLQAYQSVYDESKSLGSFYVGYWENILYAYPADVIKFGLYEGFRGGHKALTPVEGAMAGALSTAIAQFLTTPLDVVRNRIMVRSGRKDGIDDLEKGSLISYLDTLYRLGRDEGWKGLFAGSAPRVGKALVSGAVQFATYEETKLKFQSLFREANVK